MLLRTVPTGVLCLLLCLSGCGGGGGEEESPATNNPGGGTPTQPNTPDPEPSPSNAVVFTPARLSGNQEQGVPTTYSFRVGVTNPAVFTGNVYAVVVDPRSILNGQVQLFASGPTEYTATLTTSATLPNSRYQGQFEILLCKDAACTAQYPGSPVALPYDLNVTQTPLRATAVTGTEATAHAGGTNPPDVTVSLVAPGRDWTATTTASWLQILNSSGTGHGQFTVRYAIERLAPGVYSDKATVRSGDGQVSEVYFSVTVLPSEFTVVNGSPSFTAVNGAPIASQWVQFELGDRYGLSWSASTEASWLALSPNAGTTPGAISLSVNPSNGRLGSGVHTADIRLSSPGASDKVVTSTLTLVKPTLAFTAPVMTLGGPMGRDFTAQTAWLSLNTGTNDWPWALQNLPSWLSASVASGMVGYRSGQLDLAPSENATAGSLSEVLTAQATVNGDTVVAPMTVNLNLDQRRLVLSQWAIGMASTPLGSTLRRTITVRDSFGKTSGWTARSTAPWLTVTATGTTADTSNLVLTADPSLLSDNALTTATVVVESSTPGVQSATIQVGFWKSSTAPSAMTKLPTAYQFVVADKFRPYVYVNNRGAAVDIYHAYTAQMIGTIPVAGATLGQMVISPDSNLVYALNSANNSIAVIDVTNRTHAATWQMERVVGAADMTVIRPSGVDVVLLGNGTAYSRGRILAPISLHSNALAASDDGTMLFALNSSAIGNNSQALLSDFSDVSGGTVSLRRRSDRLAIYEYDAAFTPWGTTAYIASGNARGCFQVDVASMSVIQTLPVGWGGGTIHSIEVTSDGRPVCGLSNDDVNMPDIWLYSIEGYSRANYRTAGNGHSMLWRQLAVTPDGMVAISLVSDPAIAFVPIGR